MCIIYTLHISVLQEQSEGDLPQVSTPRTAVEEWILICQHNGNSQPDVRSEEDFDWTAASQSYPNLEEAPTFISRQRQMIPQHVFATSDSPQNLQGTQLDV